MTAIEVTPAGNQLYEVTVSDADGESRHLLGVPDRLLEQMDTEGVAMQDVVASAVEFLIDREGRQSLDVQVDLAVMAERYDDFAEQVPTHARRRATTQAPPTGSHAADRSEPSGDERFLRDVQEDQRAGEASHQERRH